MLQAIFHNYIQCINKKGTRHATGLCIYVNVVVEKTYSRIYATPDINANLKCYQCVHTAQL